MSRVTATKQYNTFTKGLVTESSPLTYPENASLDEDNFVLKRNGSRERRLGVDYEAGYNITATGIDAALIEGSRQSYHKWENPGGDTTVSIGVIRIYNKLWFINLLTAVPSANPLNGGAPITIANLANNSIETSVINNVLVIVGKDLPTPIKLVYTPTTQLVSQSDISIEIRDLWGVDDSLAIDARPTTLTDLHKYNLRNQGWTTKIQSICGTDAIDCTKTNNGYYPANSDIWTLGKEGDSTVATSFEKYSPAILARNSIDNAMAAQGSYILNAFNRGASRASLSGLTLPVDKESGTFTTVASYAGRIFYSGINSSITGGDSKSPNYSGYIFFSQIITNTDKLGKCYQEADPSSPNISDIIDTDGGAIQIPEATRIIRIISTQSSLLVFAENGIWEIFGDTQGFVATSYQAAKVSTNGCSSPKSIVESNGAVFAWTKAGIYTLIPSPTSGRYSAQSISLLTIQTLYNNISEIAKNNTKGYYDEKDNTIRWLYNDTSTYSNLSYPNKYNKELVFDLTLQAFYPQTFSTSVPYICDYVEIPAYSLTSSSQPVFSGTQEVLSGANAVLVSANNALARTTQFSFLTVAGTGFTLSKYNNTGFMDWFTYNGIGVSYSSFLLTGYELFGDLLRTKQTPYIWFFFQRTEDGFSTSGAGLTIDNPSSCKVQSQWSWSNHIDSGKWGDIFQAYRFRRDYVPTGPSDAFNYGTDVIVTKSKLRGSGRSLSLLIASEEGKDMKLLGWAVIVGGGSAP